MSTADSRARAVGAGAFSLPPTFITQAGVTSSTDTQPGDSHPKVKPRNCPPLATLQSELPWFFWWHVSNKADTSNKCD